MVLSPSLSPPYMIVLRGSRVPCRGLRPRMVPSTRLSIISSTRVTLIMVTPMGNLRDAWNPPFGIRISFDRLPTPFLHRKHLNIIYKGLDLRGNHVKLLHGNTLGAWQRERPNVRVFKG